MYFSWDNIKISIKEKHILWQIHIVKIIFLKTNQIIVIFFYLKLKKKFTLNKQS